jgi:hypothetical protein
MAHEIDRLFNEIKWAITDTVGEARSAVSARMNQIRGAINYAEEAAGEQWAEMMVRSYASRHGMKDSQARMVLILLGVAAASKAENATPPAPPSLNLRRALSIAMRAIQISRIVIK